jgi:hypothetical protein
LNVFKLLQEGRPLLHPVNLDLKDMVRIQASVLVEVFDHLMSIILEFVLTSLRNLLGLSKGLLIFVIES